MTLTDQDGTVVCDYCEAPYAYEANILTSEYLWVRRCKAACKRKHRDQKPRFVAAATRSSAEEES